MGGVSVAVGVIVGQPATNSHGTSDSDRDAGWGFATGVTGTVIVIIMLQLVW
jgi:hypothetical protein